MMKYIPLMVSFDKIQKWGIQHVEQLSGNTIKMNTPVWVKPMLLSADFNSVARYLRGD